MNRRTIQATAEPSRGVEIPLEARLIESGYSYETTTLAPFLRAFDEKSRKTFFSSATLPSWGEPIRRIYGVVILLLLLLYGREEKEETAYSYDGFPGNRDVQIASICNGWGLIYSWCNCSSCNGIIECGTS